MTDVIFYLVDKLIPTCLETRNVGYFGNLSISVLNTPKKVDSLRNQPMYIPQKIVTVKKSSNGYLFSNFWFLEDFMKFTIDFTDPSNGILPDYDRIPHQLFDLNFVQIHVRQNVLESGLNETWDFINFMKILGHLFYLEHNDFHKYSKYLNKNSGLSFPTKTTCECNLNEVFDHSKKNVNSIDRREMDVENFVTEDVAKFLSREIGVKRLFCPVSYNLIFLCAMQ